MATSPLNVQPSFHSRSNSSPSMQNSIASNIDENLSRLRESQLASTLSSSIGHQLDCLEDLYDSVDMLLQLPLSQQALAQENQRKLAEQLLDGSLMLLDETLNLKALKNLKHMENKLGSSSFNKDGPEPQLKSSRWSLVSKFMNQKSVMCEEEEQKANEIVNAEATLRSLIKSGNMKHVGNVQNVLQNSEMCIQDLDEGLESFFRRLIKARVTVLNSLNC
ncbi:putative Eukaryotic translation initiation factor 3 subunit A [Hibiscus syriacus]|uniref:Eukaryotic translation initiation factor 3 subunit A n=1 Tax=Hibiscus syriacus TaxID=106335 RepID=A0A6A2ZCK4_HIBSY|nr:putative Eukaryotic translation initiation factor 3 subunit A [Hibiscus syriacus]